MLVVFVSTLAFLALGASLQRHAGVPVVAVSGILIVLAAGLWQLSLWLHHSLMKDRAAKEADPTLPRASAVATESRLKWVTQLTNLAFGMALAAVIPLVEAIAP